MVHAHAHTHAYTHTDKTACLIFLNLTVIWNFPSDGHIHNDLFHIQGGNFTLNTSIIYKWISETATSSWAIEAALSEAWPAEPHATLHSVINIYVTWSASLDAGLPWAVWKEPSYFHLPVIISWFLPLSNFGGNRRSGPCAEKCAKHIQAIMLPPLFF